MNDAARFKANRVCARLKGCDDHDGDYK